MAKLEDLTVPVLRKLIRAYNLHTVIRGYSTMNKTDLINNIKKHFGIIDDTLQPRLHSAFKVNEQLNFKSKPKEKKQQIKVIEKPTKKEQEQLQKYENKVKEDKSKEKAKEAKQKEKADELYKQVDKLIQQNENILRKEKKHDLILEAMKSLKTEKQFITNPERAIENLQLIEKAIEELKKQNEKKEAEEIKPTKKKQIKYKKEPVKQQVKEIEPSTFEEEKQKAIETLDTIKLIARGDNDDGGVDLVNSMIKDLNKPLEKMDLNTNLHRLNKHLQYARNTYPMNILHAFESSVKAYNQVIKPLQKRSAEYLLNRKIPENTEDEEDDIENIYNYLKNRGFSYKYYTRFDDDAKIYIKGTNLFKSIYNNQIEKGKHYSFSSLYNNFIRPLLENYDKTVEKAERQIVLQKLEEEKVKSEEDDIENIVYLDEIAPEPIKHKTRGHRKRELPKKKNNEKVKSEEAPKSILYELEDEMGGNEKLSKSAKDIGFIKCPPRNYIMKKNDEFIKIVDEIINTLNKSAYKYAYQAKQKYKTNLDKFFKEYYNDLLKNKYISDPSVKIYTICSQLGDILPDHIRALTTEGANFYPTPFICLDKFTDRIEQAINIFEGTAGLGHILNGIRKIRSKSNNDDKDNYILKANEYDKIFCSILSLMNPDCDIIQGDYLELKINQIKPFDLMILNPPFTKGTNKNFYFEFLFKSLKLSKKR
jgi:hypothetical protein